MSKVDQLIIDLHNLTGLIQSAELHFRGLSQFVKDFTETNAINANLLVADTIMENMMKALNEMADNEDELSLKHQAHEGAFDGSNSTSTR